MVVLGGRLEDGAYGATRDNVLDDYGGRTCCGCLRCVCEDLSGPVYYWFSGFRCFVLSLLYYGDINIEVVSGVTDHVSCAWRKAVLGWGVVG